MNVMSSKTCTHHDGTTRARIHFQSSLRGGRTYHTVFDRPRLFLQAHRDHYNQRVEHPIKTVPDIRLSGLRRMQKSYLI